MPFVIPFTIMGVLSVLGLLAALFAIRHGGVETAGGTGDAVPVVTNPTPTSFVSDGPFGVGETTLHLANGAPVVVWYPASGDEAHGTSSTVNLKTLLPSSLQSLFKSLPAVNQSTGGISGLSVAEGQFPLVVFSHGDASFPTQSTFLTAHLASWGFVVAAPDHRSRDLTAVLTQALSGRPLVFNAGSDADVTDLENTISLMGTKDATSSSIFYRHLDMARIGAVGHSAGGSAVEKLAVADSKVKTFVGLAGASVGAFGQTSSGDGSTVPNQPGLLMFGDNDQVVRPASMVNAYNSLKQPKRLIGLEGAGHLVFTDVCTLDSGSGGLVGVAEKAGLPLPASLIKLGTDGCQSTDTPVAASQPAIVQSVTAQLRWALGFDASQGGLEGLVTVFPHSVNLNTTASSASL
jgi:dienelactone hydrolase